MDFAVTKGLLKGLEDLEVGGRVETIQTIALLRKIKRQQQKSISDERDNVSKLSSAEGISSQELIPGISLI